MRDTRLGEAFGAGRTGTGDWVLQIRSLYWSPRAHPANLISQRIYTFMHLGRGGAYDTCPTPASPGETGFVTYVTWIHVTYMNPCDIRI